MQVILKLTNLELTVEQKSYIENKIKALAKFYPQIVEARVEIERLEKHHSGNNIRCEVNIAIPGKLIRVERATTDWTKAINKVKDHLKVILSRTKEKRSKKR